MRRPLAKRFIVTIVITDLGRPFNERAVPLMARTSRACAARAADRRARRAHGFLFARDVEFRRRWCCEKTKNEPLY